MLMSQKKHFVLQNSFSIFAQQQAASLTRGKALFLNRDINIINIIR